MRYRLTGLALALPITLGASAVAAGDAADIEAHKKGVAAALADLGVGEFEALRCMAEMPDHVWLGSKLDKAQGAADRAAMLGCLREKNPGLTEAEFDQAVDLFR